PRSPLWKLMMKNVYFLKSSQLSQDNFRFNILYESPESGVGIGYFTEGPEEGKPLIEVLGLDRMDASMNYFVPDGVFDWLDSAAFKGGTIQASTGRIFFPYIEPFGKDLREKLGDELGNKYCFDSLYTMTQTLAQQYADKNKFYLEGYYSSSVSGEISLGYSVSPGSVSVTAGGMPLIENVDYTVDYTMGTVRIINESILASGTPISVSSENNSFSMTTKTMLGTHIDYEFSPDIHLGGTFMNLRERPMTMKNNFGEEPTSNSIWGLDFNFKKDVPLITKLVDMLPGIQTKQPSTLTLQAEFAQFIPGMANTGSKEGSTSYIDDFEGAESSIDLTTPDLWHLASTPQDFRSALPLFPESALGTGLNYGKNRALLSWYRIDNIFYSSGCPDNITAEDRSHPYSRRILEQEVFPNKELSMTDPGYIYDFNVAFYPSERGPYNYDAAPGAYSAGVLPDGTLANPTSRWGGIMRAMDYTDFESQNIETIEFWLMDPFMDP
ncbi:MAG: cell surface protein SprA, partial [Bacteroidales bacterium]|nr:cell surface protein SprA [Bacteroidales bacterium]